MFFWLNINSLKCNLEYYSIFYPSSFLHCLCLHDNFMTYSTWHFQISCFGKLFANQFSIKWVTSLSPLCKCVYPVNSPFISPALDFVYLLLVYFPSSSLFKKRQGLGCQNSTTGCVQLNCMPMFEYRKLRCLWILPAVLPETKCDDYPQSDELTPSHGGIHHPFNPPHPLLLLCHPPPQ